MDRKDIYFYKAKREGYPARSVYKLEEIDRKYKLLKQGVRVLDLGASPGSWLKYCIKKIGKKGYIVGIDIVEPSFSLPEGVVFIKGDIFKIRIDEIKREGLYDLILSDMAPHTTGVKDIDQARSLALAERTVEIGKVSLKKHGDILIKVFESSEVYKLKKALASMFARVRIERPHAVRKGSSEMYLLGLGMVKDGG